MLCNKEHRGKQIQFICLNETCRSKSLICEYCFTFHLNHKKISYSNLSTKIKLTNHQIKNKNIQKQEKIHQQQIIFDLDVVIQQFHKLNYQLKRMSPFIESMNDLFFQIEEKSDEQDSATLLLQQLDQSQDHKLLNFMFADFFLQVQFEKREENHKYPQQKTKVVLKQTTFCLIRMPLLLEEQHRYVDETRHVILQQKQRLDDFLKVAQKAIIKNKIILGNSTIIIDDLQQQKQDVDQVKQEDRQEIEEYIFSSTEKFSFTTQTGIQIYDTIEPYIGSRKQMVKLCNYWIFYHNIKCEGTLQEPTLRSISQQDINILNIPIRCIFCKMIKYKGYQNAFFRFDPAKRYGPLCYLRDKKGREIYAHEMCLLWSNRVKWNHESFTCDLYTILLAVQFAVNQKCRYCGHGGASLKCNKPECKIYFHFNCLKSTKLMMMQLDFDYKFRFLCEDHVIKHPKYNSHWFMTRLSFKLLPSLFQQQDFKQKKQQNQIDDDQNFSLDESSQQVCSSYSIELQVSQKKKKIKQK